MNIFTPTNPEHEYLQVPFFTLHGDEINHWSVPKSGWYQGGKTTGHAFGMAFMNYIRQDESRSFLLADVVTDMVDFSHMTPREEESLRGQIKGFFSEVQRALSDWAGQNQLSAPHEVGNQFTCDLANQGLSEAKWTLSPFTARADQRRHEAGLETILPFDK